MDDLQKDGGPVLHRLGEDLKQIAVIVVVHQDLQLLRRRRVTSDSLSVVNCEIICRFFYFCH